MIDIEAAIHQCPHCDGLCARDEAALHVCVECGACIAVHDATAIWREWVTAQHDEVVGSRASALEDVLMCLSEVERGASKNYALARIVARCEREIGAGWQADPDRVRFKCGIQGLIDALPVWTTLGNRAASWLRDLTDGGSDE